ncbi:cytochrome P450 [Fomitiporia mediterranea MF3/22]|uniref:cytochrome P450 n=1 Tax=Fomitiporia mediterranea (strain MF3/22) TaxID=694068 RepID=UPI00044091C9|nr:cytochrome P450 [Fomitiporia mediterranea MF3/22]EJD08416.1 cytochrome P450 [Fomitiporia mediterranea MF3/22]
MGNLLYLDVLIGCVGVYLLKHYVLDRSNHPPLPPGPKPKPIIGNLLDLPPPGQQEWIHWAKHKKLYGPISSVTMLGTTMIIINDLRIAVELLDKKSGIFSDRPILVFGGIMVGWDQCLALLRYGQRHRMIRKTLHHTIGTNEAMRKYYVQEETEVRRFLYKTMRDPSNLSENIRNVTGALILSISHGYQIEHEKSDPMVQLGEEALVQFSLAAQAGTWLVDVLPFLRFLPDWLPGMTFKRTAERFAHVASALIEKPHAFTKQQMARGVARPSLTQQLLDEHKNAPTPEEEYIIKWSAAAIYGGGADTTVGATYGFFLTMMQYPEIQRAAQAEIDAVVGPDRLPTFADRENLPYVNALVMETLRYCKVVPMGLPHVGTEDCVYEGHYIPKGALILVNIWQILHDPERYKDPHVFRPERFLGDHPEPDSHNITFGFGRRVCPGKELADHTLFLTIAMSLAVFNVSWPLDADGKPVVQPGTYIPGLITKPIDYSARITPRSAKAEALINSITFDHPFEKGDSDAVEGLHWTKQPSPFPPTY